MKLSVLQWNVWVHEKPENIMALIRDLSPDIACLQEVNEFSAEFPGHDVAEEIVALGYDSHYVVALNLKTATEQRHQGNGIFSKYPIRERRQHHVQHEDTTRRDASAENRIYVETEIDTLAGPLTVGTVHLSYTAEFVNTEGKQAETDRLIEAIKTHREGFILTGDLNAEPGSYTIQALEKRLVSAGPDYAEKTWTTKPFSYDGFEANTLDWRLDYVFATSDVKIIDSQIIKTDASDHLPILTTIEL